MMRGLRLAACLLLPAAAAAQTVGSQPGQIFDAGVSARALALGGAFTAVSGEASSLYYNPAGLGLMDGRRVEAMHAALYGGAAFDYAGYAQNLPRSAGGWGVEALRLGIGGIDGRDANDNPTASFGYSELGFGAGFGLADVLVDGLALGSGVKVDDRSLLGSSSRLIGADFGAQYGPFYDDRITTGLLLSNAVWVAQGGTSDRLSPAARVGASFAVAEPLLLVMDASNAGDFRAGFEYRCAGILALRAGWSNAGLSLGGGVLLQDSLSFDVAALDSTALGFSERVSVGYRFGAYRTKTRSSQALESLVNGKRALERRDYVEAGRDFDEALAADPAVGRKLRIDGGGWKFKIARMRRLMSAWKIDERAGEPDDLRAPTIAAQLAAAAVDALLDGGADDAMLLSQVAAGEGGRGSVFARMPNAMESATGRAQIEGATLSVSAFVADRIRRTGDAFYERRFAQAVEYCRQNTLVEPYSAPAWERLGAAELKAGDEAAAEAAYRKSLAINPDNRALRELLRTRFTKPAN